MLTPMRLLPYLLLSCLLIGAAPAPSNDLDFVLDHVSQFYYGKIAGQALLDGELAGMQRYLRSRGIKDQLPPVTSSQDSIPELHLAARQALVAAEMRYGSRIDRIAFENAALKGIAAAANDRYTVYLTAAEYKAFSESMAPVRFAGVGVVVQTNPADGVTSVFDVTADGPAQRAGVRQDDVLLAVDGKATHGLATRDISKLLRGTPGTLAQLELRRGEQTLSLTVTRAFVQPPTVVKHLLPGDVGYVELYVFGERTAAEFNAALSDLQARGARAYVIDLRNNGGGEVNAALSISSRFIDSGPLITTVTRGGKYTTIYGEGDAIAPKPLVVLANAYSASASEITIGALVDSGVATFVGTKTFGKGVMQDVFALRDGAALKVTAMKYFTPKNHDINHVGITPDIVVQENPKAVFGIPQSDAQLDAALKVISSKLAAISQ